MLSRLYNSRRILGCQIWQGITASRFSTTKTILKNLLAEVTKVKKISNKLIELKEEDLVQKQIKGWGSGGQKTNKTSNCIALTHIPTGITVKVHSGRSVYDNMAIARARLRMKVDVEVKGDASVIMQEELEKQMRKVNGKIKAERTLVNKSKLKKLLEREDDIKY